MNIETKQNKQEKNNTIIRIVNRVHKTNNSPKFVALIALTFSMCNCPNLIGQTLREAFADKFLIGAALNTRIVGTNNQEEQQLVRNQFSAVVAENCMKMESVQPIEGHFEFTAGDSLCTLAEKNNQIVTGHCLVWHSQAPKWFFTDANGNTVSREVLIERMRTHIYTVAGHFKGKIIGWDVVNEAFERDGSFRRSPFYEIIGPDFISLAFQFAHEADPDAELYYNDYDMASPNKRKAVVELVKDLKSKGLKIDGIGMQSHLAFDTNLDEYEKSLEAFAETGVKVMATELDLSLLPYPRKGMGAAIETNFDYQSHFDPYKNGVPEEKLAEQTEFYTKLFDIYLRYSNDVTRVTFWGVTDGDSWKNDWPIHGRTDYPLPFGRDLKAKPFVSKLIKMAKDSKYNQTN